MRAYRLRRDLDGALGRVLAAIWTPPALFQTGISFAARQVMRVGVAPLGFQISLATLQILDMADVAALAINVAIVLVAGWFLGRCMLRGLSRASCLRSPRRFRVSASSRRWRQSD
jgi:uncharacterized membrane protein YadS